MASSNACKKERRGAFEAMTGRPKGRPPLNHRCSDGEYVHEESATPYAEGREEHERTQRELRKRARRERYAANASCVRDKQRAYLSKRRRERGAEPRRLKLPNCTLDETVAGMFIEPPA